MNIYDDKLAYLVQLRSEHRDVNITLHHITMAIEEFKMPISADSSIRTVCEELTNLRKELQHHFLLEEDGGCLDEAVARCPSLGKEADAIKCEHPGLLLQLDLLISHAARMQTQPEKKSFCEQWEKFVCELSSHEDMEDRLLISGLEGRATHV